MKLIAFAGRMKTGKTTISDIILELDPSFKKLSFSTPLKEAFAKYAGIDVTYLMHPTYKEEYRAGMQQFSQSYLEKDPEHFVNILFDKIQADDKIVIDDLRTLRELARVVKSGGTPYQMYASEKIRMSRGWIRNPLQDNHFSESDLDLEPTVFRDLGGDRIYNERGLDNLTKEARRVLANLK